MLNYDLTRLLEGKPLQLVRAVVIRAALRVFPIAGASIGPIDNSERLTLAVLRALISALSAHKFPKDALQLTSKASEAPLNLTIRFDASTRSAFSSAIYCAKSFQVDDHIYINSIIDSTQSAYTTISSNDEMISEAYVDVGRMELTTTDIYFDIPLWGGEAAPKPIISKWSEFGNWRYRNNDAWLFWREWYQGFLDGKPMDWELQRRLALIEDAIWDAGPEAVAEEIERIRAAYEVERRAVELEGSASMAITTLRGVGDNNPPSPIYDAVNAKAGITIIWDAARELKEEARSETPNKERVKKAVASLVRVMKVCGLWGAKKIDTGLNAAVGAIGVAGGTVGVAWITQNGDKVAELIKAAERWLTFF